jgi:hypothetical protein
VIAIHLDYDDRADSAYYEVKLLCNEEDLAGAPLAIIAPPRKQTHPPARAMSAPALASWERPSSASPEGLSGRLCVSGDRVQFRIIRSR